MEAFESGQGSTQLQNWREAFAEILIADLNQPEKVNEFADRSAQTPAYGLFSVRPVSSRGPGWIR